MTKRRHKYDALRTWFQGRHVSPDGDRYASATEAAYAQVLDYLVQAGLYETVRRQVRIDLGEDACTIVDFVVTEAGGGDLTFAIEVKGYETPGFKRVRRLWPKYGPYPMYLVKRKGARWVSERIPGKDG